MNDQKNNKRSKGGRKPKINPCNHRYVFRLDDEDNSKFLSLFEASGIDNKAKFITSVLFSKEIKTVKIDKGTVDFYMRLTSFYSQFRAVGVNYNQVVKLLYTHFTEKKPQHFCISWRNTLLNFQLYAGKLSNWLMNLLTRI